MDVQAAEARSLVVEGTLRASRGVASRLTLYGNLIVRGTLDYGRPNDRVVVPASIRWFLDESRYVGGPTMTVVASDVGLWAIDSAQVWVHGVYRDTWSPLAAPAPAGTTDIAVDPRYAAGWTAGDEIVVGPTNLRTGDNDAQDERRQIVADLGNGRFRLDAPLRWNHDALTVSWTDAWGDTWNERLAAKVINLTSNIAFQAGDPAHRPHIIFLDRARHYVEDLAVVNFSPMPVVEPMSRYAWHQHAQGDGSRGSYLRRARLYGGPGDGIHIHESWGISVEDLVVYDQARAYVVPASGRFILSTVPFMLERSTPNDRQHHAADDCWIDRALVMRWGYGYRDYLNAGFWLSGSRNCAVVGVVAAGGNGRSRSSGMHWEAGSGGGENPYVYKAEAHSNRIMGFHSWQNMTPTQAIVDLLAWRNGDVGVGWGAYGTSYWAFQVRSLGNRVAQLAHWAARWGITGFLADGMGVGEAGIEVRRYFAVSTADTVYEDGVVRNVTQANARHEQSASVSGTASSIQFVRVLWDAARSILFDGSTVPPNGSRFRIRQQQNLSRAANFTLYRAGDPAVPANATWDAQYNALRVDNDTAGTRPRPPRVRLVTPADDTVATGVIRLTVQSDAAEVEFYQANRRLGSVPVVGGSASFDFNMGSHPQRRAYFWASATGASGAVNASRVIRVRKF